MGRLIDADELLKEFDPNGERLDPIFVRSRIVQQTTAYDVEKVVAETGNVLNDLNVVEVLSHVEPYTTIQRPLENFLDSFKAEIRRIVKRGGAE